ncbi:MAG: hypothetical protein WBG57_01440 [Ornithinimicrobium sp.]
MRTAVSVQQVMMCGDEDGCLVVQPNVAPYWADYNCHNVAEAPTQSRANPANFTIDTTPRCWFAGAIGTDLAWMGVYPGEQ